MKEILLLNFSFMSFSLHYSEEGGRDMEQKKQ